MNCMVRIEIISVVIFLERPAPARTISIYRTGCNNFLQCCQVRAASVEAVCSGSRLCPHVP